MLMRGQNSRERVMGGMLRVRFTSDVLTIRSRETRELNQESLKMTLATIKKGACFL